MVKVIWLFYCARITVDYLADGCLGALLGLLGVCDLLLFAAVKERPIFVIALRLVWLIVGFAKRSDFVKFEELAMLISDCVLFKPDAGRHPSLGDFGREADLLIMVWEKTLELFRLVL